MCVSPNPTARSIDRPEIGISRGRLEHIMSNPRLFAGLSAEDIVEFEKTTGLFVADEEYWLPEDYRKAIGFFRQRAGIPVPTNVPNAASKLDDIPTNALHLPDPPALQLEPTHH
jgi:hypothetical protein